MLPEKYQILTERDGVLNVIASSSDKHAINSLWDACVMPKDKLFETYGEKVAHNLLEKIAPDKTLKLPIYHLIECHRTYPHATPLIS